MADTLYLASRSPRRRELIKLLGVPTEIIEAADVDEDLLISDIVAPPVEISLHLSRKKSELVVDNNPPRYILCADTSVIYEGELMGKPLDANDATRMLMLLSNGWHIVATGITLISPNDEMISDFEKTRVKFARLSKEQVESYVETGEPMDKAGAYGIQGFAAPFVERIEGCYFNVVGLPLNLLFRTMVKAGFNFTDS